MTQPSYLVSCLTLVHSTTYFHATFFAGQLSTHKSLGSGSVNVSLRRITSPDGWAEVEMGFGSGPSLSIKGFRNLTKRVFTNISGIITSTERGLTLGFVSSELHSFE